MTNEMSETDEFLVFHHDEYHLWVDWIFLTNVGIIWGSIEECFEREMEINDDI